MYNSISKFKNISVQENIRTFSDEEVIEKHIEKLNSCGTSWIALWVESELLGGHPVLIKNHCRARDCKCPACIQSRIAKQKKRLKKYFKMTDHVRHVILTHGVHTRVDKAVLKGFRKNIRNFLRRLTRGKKAKPYTALFVIEAKKEPDGLYNLHTHMGFFGWCPHHIAVTKIWSEVCGSHRDTQVKYRVKKDVLLNYFARRSSMAGYGMEAKEYIKTFYKSRMVEVFNARGKETQKLLILKYRKQLDQEDMEIVDKWLWVMYIGTYPAIREARIPPPALLEQAKAEFEARI